FDDKGLPKKGGTALIAIDCDQLKGRGSWWKKDDLDRTYFDVIVHELLHATNKNHTHGTDGAEIYDTWVKNFLDAMKKKDTGGGGSKGDEKDKKKKAPSKPKNRRRRKPPRAPGGP
ncbi:MAG TPA: hypothetical protein VMU54_21660, partial [Planctomycetota bacterium]|nr:hypothetical protein [Planctomycetota bacterium]